MHVWEQLLLLFLGEEEEVSCEKIYYFAMTQHVIVDCVHVNNKLQHNQVREKFYYL